MTAASTPPVSVQATEMRQRLLDSALAILQNTGAAALTVRNISEGAGCSTTGIYTYFGGKQGLVEAIYLDGFSSFDETLMPYCRSGDLMAAGRHYRRWALDNPMHYLVMFGRAVADFEPSESAFQRGVQSFVALVEAVARAGAVEPELAAYHLYATAHGYVMLELVGMGQVVGHGVEPFYEAGMRRALESIGLA